MYEMTKNDKGPKIFWGKVYEWVLNAKGRLSLQKVEVTDEDREEFGAEVDEFIKENQK